MKTHNYWKIVSLILVFACLTLLFVITIVGRRDRFQSSTQLQKTNVTDPNIVSIIPDNWKTYSSDIVTFRFPPEWNKTPIQLYPHHDSIIVFSNGAILTLVPYDSYRFSEAQRAEGITMNSMTFVDPEKYENLTIDNHAARRLRDSFYERVVVDVPEKSMFVELSFTNQIPSLGQEAFVGRWVDPLLSTIRFGKTEPVSTTILNLDYIIPPNWKTYDKKFQDLHFQFRYPEPCKIDDGDEASGDIYISCNGVQQHAVAITRMLGEAGYVSDYEGGSQTEFFINNLIDYLSSGQTLSRNKLLFSELKTIEGTTFYLAQYTDKDVFPALNHREDYYFTFIGKNGISVHDSKQLPKEQVYMILQSLKVQ